MDWLLNGRARWTGNPEDPEFEAAVLTLRAIWRDPIRRRLTIAMLSALAQK